MFICHLVLGDEQGPGANLEEPPWACNGWGCQGTCHALWEGMPPWQVSGSLPVGGLRGLADAQKLQTIQGQLNNQFPYHYLVKPEKKGWVSSVSSLDKSIGWTSF